MATHPIDVFTTPDRAVSLANAFFATTLSTFRILVTKQKFFSGDMTNVCLQRDRAIDKLSPGADFLPNPLRILRPHVEERNQLRCIPALLNGFNGDMQARRYYEQNRIIHFGTSPEWIKETTRRATIPIFKEIEGKKLKHQINGESRTFVWDLKLVGDDQAISVNLFIDSLITFDGGKKLFGHLAKIQKQIDDLQIVTTKVNNQGRSYASTKYSPLSAKAFSDNAQRALRAGLEAIFTATIIDDLLASKEISLPDDVKIKIATSGQKGWNLVNSKKLTDIFPWVDSIRALPESAEMKQWLIDNLPLKPYSPNAFLEYEKCMQQVAARQQRDAGPARPQIKTTEDVKTSSNVRDVFLNGITVIIEDAHPEIRNARQLAKKFHALVRRGATHYEELAEMIGAKTQNPYELLETLYLERLRREKPENEIRTLSDEALLPHQENQQLAQTRVVPLVIGGEPHFANWLSNLPVAQQEIVLSRMFRMETGNLGDYTSIRGFTRGLLEARIHSDPPLRLYFARTGKSEFGLVWGGDKLTQIADIKRATALWREYLNPSSQP